MPVSRPDLEETGEPRPAAAAKALRPWQTPRVITGAGELEIAAAEGLGDLFEHPFFMGS